VRFAAALAASFRPTDAVVRYAGDEFVVVASGLDRAAIDERIASVRLRLTASPGELPVRFAFGIGNLPAGGDPDEALRAADEAMYSAKPASSRHLGAAPDATSTRHELA
jgi:diguanylate cyclase (GGDEF)-like protein